MEQRSKLGVVIYALNHHQRQGWGGRHAGLAAPLALLEECRRLGGGGIQCPLTAADASIAPELHRRSETYGLHVEASLSPPSDAADVKRFERDVEVAKAAGADLARTVIIPGRRYEQFQSLSEFREAEAQGLKSLQWAVPVLARHRFRLAVENHKDQRIAERLEILRQVNSEWVGLCVDVGNSFALLEEPLETVRAYAPWAMTVHLKDQGLRESDQGFLFADLPLGEGFLELPEMVATLQTARPGIHFNLEMITRDALNVPVLRPDYWSTLGDVPARDLGRTLRLLKHRAHPTPFLSISTLSAAEQLAAEENHVRLSLEYAVQRLGL